MFSTTSTYLHPGHPMASHLSTSFSHLYAHTPRLFPPPLHRDPEQEMRINSGPSAPIRAFAIPLHLCPRKWSAPPGLFSSTSPPKLMRCTLFCRNPTCRRRANHIIAGNTEGQCRPTAKRDGHYGHYARKRIRQGMLLRSLARNRRGAADIRES